MYARLNAAAMAKAGGLTGLILYVLCVAFYLVVYGGTGEWMIRPFMPGAGGTPVGYLIGLGWALLYGAGIPWLLVVLYNAFAGKSQPPAG